MLTRANPDRDLIRLCKKAVEALKADLIACNAKCDVQAVFEKTSPRYPYEAGRWRCSASRQSVSDLREHLRKSRATAAPSYLAKLRLEIKAVAVWKKQIDALRGSSGLKAAEAREVRASARARGLVKQVIDTPAHTAQGVAAKAGVVEHWLDAGYAIDDAAEGYELVMVILDDIRLVAGGADRNLIRRLRYHSDDPAEMAAAA